MIEQKRKVLVQIDAERPSTAQLLRQDLKERNPEQRSPAVQASSALKMDC
jgi:hypothetical protein